MFNLEQNVTNKLSTGNSFVIFLIDCSTNLLMGRSCGHLILPRGACNQVAAEATQANVEVITGP